MKLLLPQVAADSFESRIIHAGIVAVHDFAPDIAAVFGGMFREIVQAVLEAVDASHPREQPDHVGEFAFGAADDRFVVVAVERFQVRHADEFHAHACDFGKFSRDIAVSEYRLVRKCKLMERMAGFMQQCVNVAVRIGGVHENEGEAAFVKTDLVSARSLAQPGIWIDKLFCLHFTGPLACLRVYAFENGIDFFNEFVTALVRLERRPA